MSLSSPCVSSPYRQCSLEELDNRDRHAEECMNRALDQREWIAVRRYRDDMLAVRAEFYRRLAPAEGDSTALWLGR